MIDLKKCIRDVKNFPVKGVIFKDITPLLGQPLAFKEAVSSMILSIKDVQKITHVAGLESRGFIFGSAVADRLNLPFVLIRKEGKLPGKKIIKKYSTEYGESSIEINKDAIKDPKKSNVLIVDDVLATGGTTNAIVDMLKELGVKRYSASFLINLRELHEGKNIKCQYTSVLDY